MRLEHEGKLDEAKLLELIKEEQTRRSKERKEKEYRLKKYVKGFKGKLNKMDLKERESKTWENGYT